MDAIALTISGVVIAVIYGALRYAWCNVCRRNTEQLVYRNGDTEKARCFDCNVTQEWKVK